MPVCLVVRLSQLQRFCCQKHHFPEFLVNARSLQSKRVHYSPFIIESFYFLRLYFTLYIVNSKIIVLYVNLFHLFILHMVVCL